MGLHEYLGVDEIIAATQKVFLGWMSTGVANAVIPELVGTMGKINDMSVPEIEAIYYFLVALSWTGAMGGTFLAVRDVWDLVECEYLPDAQPDPTHLYI